MIFEGVSGKQRETGVWEGIEGGPAGWGERLEFCTLSVQTAIPSPCNSPVSDSSTKCQYLWLDAMECKQIADESVFNSTQRTKAVLLSVPQFPLGSLSSRLFAEPGSYISYYHA